MQRILPSQGLQLHIFTFHHNFTLDRQLAIFFYYAEERADGEWNGIKVRQNAFHLVVPRENCVCVYGGWGCARIQQTYSYFQFWLSRTLKQDAAKYEHVQRSLNEAEEKRAPLEFKAMRGNG